MTNDQEELLTIISEEIDIDKFLDTSYVKGGKVILDWGYIFPVLKRIERDSRSRFKEEVLKALEGMKAELVEVTKSSEGMEKADAIKHWYNTGIQDAIETIKGL